MARAARKHPVLLTMLEDGRLHLSGIAKLAPHLTVENRDWLLSRAVHKTKRQIQELLAELAPRPDVPGVMRELPDRPIPADRPRAETVELGLDGVGTSPEPVPAGELGPDGVPSPAELRLDAAPVSVPLPGPSALLQPLSPARYKVQFTAGAELHDKLERLEARRFARVKSPRREAPRRDPAPASRYLSASVRRAVDRRDGGQCCFVDAQGRRCPARHHLEYHHRRAFGRGGGGDVDNICLMCPAHNRLMAELDYGKDAMSRYWGRRPSLRTAQARNSVQTG